MDDHYILPGEFALLLLLWFGPPLAIAILWQFHRLRSRGGLYRHILRAALLAVATSAVSITCGVGLLALSPRWLSFLGVVDVPFGRSTWPVLPLAFVVVALIAPAFWWLLAPRRSRA